MRAKEQSIIIYNQAHMVADFVSLRLNGKPIPSYDELFSSEVQQKEEEELAYKKAMLLKEQFMF